MKRFPNAIVIILGVIVLSWVLTFIVPRGSYDRLTNPDTGQTTVISGSYQLIEGESLGFFDLIMAIPEGLISRASLIFLIFLLGGSFYIIEKTGALGQGLQWVVDILQKHEGIALTVISLLFAAAGATIGLQEEIIAMAPILILFCRSLGFNVYVAVASSYGSAVMGAAFSPMNPFAVVLAQKEANLSLMSGSSYRLLFFGLAFALWVWYLIRYAKKNRVEREPMNPNRQEPSWRNFAILGMLCLTFGIVTYGLVSLDWGFNEISACFFLLGLVAGLLGNLGINGTGLTYIEGMKEMTFAAMIMGLASCIPLLLKEGMIMDTIIHGLFTPIEELPASLSALGMMASQALLHFPVSSYSAQAILTMPILTPLSDLVGISRQVCVLAYQYGAVNMDFIVPTNGALMAILAIAEIPYHKWIRFIWRPLVLFFSLAAIAIVTGVLTGF
ncbi:MAG: YfcC family protein [Bacteroidetes bacterium]|jgi:uncharacterized ion transporter superfamily protein YfcC|nr:MAG: YfcC family protein [Bacteroidota bacterium]UCE68581.1 MAG: YfcC family protein [Flavobacteriaceae bacterium]